eukprot:5204339-Alexandrium_andersonii.AAC.1
MATPARVQMHMRSLVLASLVERTHEFRSLGTLRLTLGGDPAMISLDEAAAPARPTATSRTRNQQ